MARRRPGPRTRLRIHHNLRRDARDKRRTAAGIEVGRSWASGSTPPCGVAGRSSYARRSRPFETAPCAGLHSRGDPVSALAATSRPDRPGCAALPLPPGAVTSPVRVASARNSSMCARPKACSADRVLCALQRIRRFSTVLGPPSAAGRRWSSSTFHVLPQRWPSGPRQVQRPSSRFQTSRRTAAGMGWRPWTVFFAGFAATGLFLFRAGSAAPLRLRCFSSAHWTASRSTAARSPLGACGRGAPSALRGPS